MNRRQLRWSAISISVYAVVQMAGCDPTSRIEDLGTLGGDSSIGLGINKAGNVTGSAYVTPGQHHTGLHAFRYVDGLGMIDVGALPTGDISEGNGINSGGLIGGGSFVMAGGELIPHAFRANASLGLTDLGTLGGSYSYAWDINDRGQVTGEAENGQANSHAFLWGSAGMTDLGTLGGTTSVGRSINENGQVAGESKLPNDTAKRAFRYTQGAGMVNLGTLGGKNSSGYGINDSGQVVGESDTGLVIDPRFFFHGMTFLTHAFRWTEGSGMLDPGHLGGGDSRATAINNNGAVVGDSTLFGGIKHAFRWTQAEGMIDLNTLLPRRSDWLLHSAWDINDKGQITGQGLHNGQPRAYRLNPMVGEPPASP